MVNSGVVDGFDYLYVETRDWDRTAAFWAGVGFEFRSRWGDVGHRAGRLEAGTAAVVVAEVGEDRAPATRVFFSVPSAGDVELEGAGEVVSPATETHWGTRLVEVRDPDGNVYALQEGGR